MSYDLSKFSIISFKKSADDNKKEEICKNCGVIKDRFVCLKECGHLFCRDCVDELYDDYVKNVKNVKNVKDEEMFVCPNEECCLKIYDIIYM